MVGDRHSPAGFRFTYDSAPERHREVSEFLTGESIAPGDMDADTLPRILTDLMRDVHAPSGVRVLGYDENDIPELVQGALKQQCLLVIAPKEPGPDDLANIYRDSMENW